MIRLDFITQPQVDPAVSLATDRYLRRTLARRSRLRQGVLRVFSSRGDCLSLGRYHLAPYVQEGVDVRVFRRQTGGRVLPFGDGFVGISLILPHRSALFSTDPLALAPYQVLNRYVRGLLESCRVAKLPVSYPGRDLVTVGRRVVAVISFDTDENGTLLFEAVIASTRDFSVLPDLLEVADSQGVIKAEMLTAEDTTCLAVELGDELSFDALAALIRKGYEKYFGIELVPQTFTALEQQAIDALAMRECRSEEWLRGRARRPELEQHVATWAQLGVFEAFFSVQQDRFIKDILFAGDFIANAPAIAALERNLRLCPLEWRAVNAVVDSIFEQPANYLLGIGKLRVIADLLAR